MRKNIFKWKESGIYIIVSQNPIKKILTENTLRQVFKEKEKEGKNTKKREWKKVASYDRRVHMSSTDIL